MRRYAKKICCKTDAHSLPGWCRDLSIVHTDEDGKRYCVFHAPRGKKNISVEKFKKLIFQAIDNVRTKRSDAHDQRETCNLSDTIFEGDIDFRDFRGTRFLPDIDFSGAQFGGEANFSGAQFGQRTSFWKAQFGGEANFSGAQFGRWTSFSEAQFGKEVKFIDARFGGRARFGLVQFNGDVHFSGTQFGGKTSFWKAQFKEEASFYRTLFDREVDFTRVYAGRALHFEEVDLSHARFADADAGRIDFINCRWPEKGKRRIFDNQATMPRVFAGIRGRLKMLLSRRRQGKATDGIRKKG